MTLAKNSATEATLIHSDFSRSVVVRPEDYRWQSSPVQGVDRMMLDRVGGEVARATTVVRYAPNSQFSTHVHGGGEEFFVLEGVFADEQGEYPAGSYVRNPAGTSHTPIIGAEGATILVKLNQFDPGDTEQKCIDTQTTHWQQGLVAGLTVMALHDFAGEHVALVKWAPKTQFQAHRHWGGEEIFVLSGVFHDEHGQYPAGSWLRSPHLSEHTPFTQDEGALIFVKVRHLG
ncbi:cupin domain-containing protein [Reinekea sp.]|uniref:cupin domain-containing protein n=1 Tax=Reinekea sp. TaxID=1970455 RepID=UPI002A817338|nr:cupin domain-containing protein [Reinekea sp.]